MYDVYYTTAGGPWFNSGADIWVTNWIKEVAPDLKVKPLLLFHRHKPTNYEEFPIDIDHIWETSEDKIIEILEGARRIHILHGHYTPTRAIHQNLEKIDSIVFHNLTKVSLMAQQDKDEYLHWYGNWEYENELINKIKNKVWVGLYHFPYKTDNLYHIPNCYEFTANKEVYGSELIDIETDFLTETKEIKPIFAATPLSNLTGDDKIVSDFTFVEYRDMLDSFRDAYVTGSTVNAIKTAVRDVTGVNPDILQQGDPWIIRRYPKWTQSGLLGIVERSCITYYTK
jgi:hypothetical protein